MSPQQGAPQEKHLRALATHVGIRDDGGFHNRDTSNATSGEKKEKKCTDSGKNKNKTPTAAVPQGLTNLRRHLKTGKSRTQVRPGQFAEGRFFTGGRAHRPAGLAVACGPRSQVTC